MSAALHVLVLVLLFVTIDRTRQDEKPEQLPPPAVSVIFEGGAKSAPAQPTPSPQPDNATPSPQATPAPLSPPQPDAPPEPAAPPQPQAEPAPEEPVPPTPPAPPPQSQAHGPPRVELYAPPPPLRGPAPFEVPELPPAPPPPPRPQARPAPRPPQLAQPRNPLSPTFREWSLGRPSAPSSQGLGPNVAGPPQAASQIQGAEKLGTDWRNALSAWVEAHKYYPQQAAIAGEDGSPQVEVTVRRDGKVLDVQLEQRSGSQLLDIALQALFRGARLPPFPDTSNEQQLTFHFTMHYILVRR